MQAKGQAKVGDDVSRRMGKAPASQKSARASKSPSRRLALGDQCTRNESIWERWDQSALLIC